MNISILSTWCFFLFFTEVVLYSTVINVSTQQDFDKVTHRKKISVVKFYAPWCGPCKASEAPFESLSNDPDLFDIQFLTVNTDSFQILSQKYNIKTIPSFLFFKNGDLIKRSKTINLAHAHNTVAFKKEILEALTSDDSTIITPQENPSTKHASCNHCTSSNSCWIRALIEFIMIPIYMILNGIEKLWGIVKSFI